MVSMHVTALDPDIDACLLMSMYAFLPLPVAVKALTNNKSACKPSIDCSSVLISRLARAARSSLRLAAA